MSEEEIIGYVIDGEVYHPDEVLVVRRSDESVPFKDAVEKVLNQELHSTEWGLLRRFLGNCPKGHGPMLGSKCPVCESQRQRPRVVSKRKGNW